MFRPKPQLDDAIDTILDIPKSTHRPCAGDGKPHSYHISEYSIMNSGSVEAPQIEIITK